MSRCGRNTKEASVYQSCHFAATCGMQAKTGKSNMSLTTIKSKLSTLRPKHWGLIILGVALMWLAARPGDAAVDPTDWSCDALIQPVIEMSEERLVTVLEISNSREKTRTYGPHPSIDCWGSAEWSQGTGSIQYGAHVTDGGNIILEYAQR